MKPRKPKTVRVMGADYRIEFKALKDLFGIVNFTDRVVSINNIESEAVQKESLLHELFHVVMEECTGLSNKKCLDREEEIVRYVSPRMFQLFRDNPKVKHYIFD
ncbi:hypothetical protein M0R04_11440 [Candidatus Dojkabacteria bacterium]|jgi:hypothetical protein|nr:hypothetical protein [Candidatus Dojkabacteria bacterium]